MACRGLPSPPKYVRTALESLRDPESLSPQSLIHWNAATAKECTLPLAERWRGCPSICKCLPGHIKSNPIDPSALNQRLTSISHLLQVRLQRPQGHTGVYGLVLSHLSIPSSQHQRRRSLSDPTSRLIPISFRRRTTIHSDSIVSFTLQPFPLALVVLSYIHVTHISLHSIFLPNLSPLPKPSASEIPPDMQPDLSERESQASQETRLFGSALSSPLGTGEHTPLTLTMPSSYDVAHQTGDPPHKLEDEEVHDGPNGNQVFHNESDIAREDEPHEEQEADDEEEIDELGHEMESARAVDVTTRTPLTIHAAVAMRMFTFLILSDYLFLLCSSTFDRRS